MKFALVTGSSGFLGSALVGRLLADGLSVRAMVRSPTKGEALAAQGAEVVVGEITDEAAVRGAVEGASVVYHLAGRLLAPGVSPTVYRATHVDGTRLLLRCCGEEPSVERLVHCSTTGVLGITGERPADEDAPFHPTNVYEATKAEAELAVRERWRDGVPAVVARPGLVYGPGDLHLLPFFRSVLRRRFRPIGRKPVWLHPIYIDDLVDGLVRCGAQDSALGECFHLAGREPVPLAGLADAIATAGGTPVPSGHIPLPAAQAVAAIGDRLPRAVRRSAPLTSSRLEFLTHSRMYDVSKAERVLGFTAPTNLETGTVLSMAWYREQGHLPSPAGVRG